MLSEHNESNLIQFAIPANFKPKRYRARDSEFAQFMQTVSPEKLRFLVDQLSDRQREAIQLAYVSMMPRKQIAQVTGSSESSVSNRIAGAIDRLVYLRDSIEQDESFLTTSTLAPEKHLLLRQALLFRNAECAELDLANSLTREKFLREKLKRLQKQNSRMVKLLFEEGDRDA